MIINSQGLELDNLNSLLQDYETQLKKYFGEKFQITPESALGNLALVNCTLALMLESEIAELAKQFDPLSATGIWQDALYERIGIKRHNMSKTIFTYQVNGAPNVFCEAKYASIRCKSNDKLFFNIKDFTTDENGIALVDFECIEFGKIAISAGEEFEIITMPDGIDSISEPENIQISIGRDRETDDEFRKRFMTSKSLNARASYNANIANLVKYVDDIKFLKIIDVKNDQSFEPGTAQIIAHHNTTDNIFANAIFDTIAAGIELLGNTEVIVNDIEGTPHTVRFHKAEEVPLTISASIKIKNGYYQNSVCSEIKTKILDYVNEHVYGLEETIYANEFIIPILSTDGVAAVTDIKIKKAKDEDFTDSVVLTREQIPIFLTENFVIFV